MAETLPKGWKRQPLGDVLDIIRGVSYTKTQAMLEPAPGYLPILRATNINGKLDFENLVYVPQERVSDVQMLQKGDIVVAASSGSKSVVGKAAQLTEDWAGSFGAFCFGLRVKPGTEPKYVAYYLQTREYRDTVSRLSAGSNINNLRREHILSFPIRLAPLDDQRRIVARIEELFSKLDAGVEALRRARANLKRYRASVLKAAVEGRLTADWRAEQKRLGRRIEPADQLLQRILKERRARWEQSQPPGKKKKYKEPSPPSSEFLAQAPPLPEGWCWATVEQVGHVTGGLTKSPKRITFKTRLPYLRVANVYANELRLHEVLRIGAEAEELPRFQLQRGDLLVVEGNGSPDQIGRVAMWDGSIDPCLHQNHIIKIRCCDQNMGGWTLYWMLSPNGRGLIYAASSSTSGLNTLSLNKIQNLPVPFPPYQEQKQAVMGIQHLLSLEKWVLDQHATVLAKAVSLKNQILHDSFRRRSDYD